MTVPGNATTGPIAVTTPGGTATSATSFTVAPRITSFTPANGVIGTSVTINGANFTGARRSRSTARRRPLHRQYADQDHGDRARGGDHREDRRDDSGRHGHQRGKLHRQARDRRLHAGQRGRLAPGVTITGTGFTGATSVRINGFAAAFTVNPSTQITTTVPGQCHERARSASRRRRGTATSATSFTVAPRITSFTPAHGGIGASVAINGANFTGATSVTFNGTSAATYIVNSAVKITATVPAGASTGKIGVTTSAGTATSTNNFTIP